MDKGLLVQFAASVAAIGALLAVSAWARIARPIDPLTAETAKTLLTREFGRALDGVWVSTDGRGAIGRSGVMALVIYQVGDGYLTRRLPWANAVATTRKDGQLRLELGDPAAPTVTLVMGSWPPGRLAA